MGDWVEKIDIEGTQYDFVEQDSKAKLDEAYSSILKLQKESGTANIVSGSYNKVITLQKQYKEILRFNLTQGISSATLQQWSFTAPNIITCQFQIVYGGNLLPASGVSGTINYEVIGLKQE